MTVEYDDNLTRFVPLSKISQEIEKTQFISLGRNTDNTPPTLSAVTGNIPVETCETLFMQRLDGDSTIDDVQTVPTSIPKDSAQNQTDASIFHTIVNAIESRSFKTRELVPGDTIDRYQVEEVMAVGGTSRVYQIIHKYLNQRFALKTLKESTSKHTAQLFLEEAKTLSKMSHSNVVGIFDAGVSNSLPYIVLEFLQGKSLRELIIEEYIATKEQALDLLEDICSVFLQQEKHGIVHGDIKPENIILRHQEGRFCLIDYGHFGRDNNTQDNNILFMGTPKYMAPELKMGDITMSADFYSLGLTLCEFLGGKPKENITSDKDDIDAFSNFEFSIAVPPILSRILQSLTAYDRNTRYQSASDLFDDLKRIRNYDETVHGAMVGNAFIAIEFSDVFEHTFAQLERCCLANRLRCRRMDRLVFTQDIWRNIELEIEHAKVVLADFTISPKYKAPNPNVLTEAAHARAIGKPLLIISQTPPEALPFDWRHMPVLVYQNNEQGLIELQQKLSVKLLALSR